MTTITENKQDPGFVTVTDDAGCYSHIPKHQSQAYFRATWGNNEADYRLYAEFCKANPGRGQPPLDCLLHWLQ